MTCSTMIDKLVLFSVIIAVSDSEVRHDYLTSTCNATISATIDGSLEPSTQLTYENHMDCVFHVTAPATKHLMVIFNWFDLERKVNGLCLDYLNIHDGGDVMASTLNADPLCGEQRSLGNVTTSGRNVTFHFVTDADAIYRGFDLTYTVFSYAPCGSSDFTCANNICVDSSLQCDDVSQCGDGSDETTELCNVNTRTPTGPLSVGAIVGIVGACLVLIIALALVAYKVIDYYLWQRWLRQNDLRAEMEGYQYPITDLYYSKPGPLDDDVTAARNTPAQLELAQDAVMSSEEPASEASRAEAKWSSAKTLNKSQFLSLEDIPGSKSYSSDA